MGSYFTVDDLRAVWLSSVDPLYSRPFVDAGDGNGLEAYNQAFAQYERVSQAITRSLQAMYVLPHSAQLSEPASGDACAIVSVNVERAGAYQYPITFTRGLMVEEVATDHGEDGGVQVRTGRRYVMEASAVFEPGATGPLVQRCAAQYPGYSFNNPQPGSITGFVQVGAGQYNGGATVVPGEGEDLVYAANEYATFLPEMVGQYLRLSGANDGKVRRISSYQPPGSVPFQHGGAVGLVQEMVLRVGAAIGYASGEKVIDSVTGAEGKLLAYNATTGTAIVERRTGVFAVGGNLTGDASLASSAIAAVDTHGMLAALYLGASPPGAWLAGELLTQAVTLATGWFLRMAGEWAIVNPVSGQFDAANPVTGAASLVVMTPSNVGVEPSLVQEGGTCAWHVMEWGADLGFTCTNPLSPTGGTLGLLDEIGRERNVPRSDGETDASYRKRVARIPDTVSPNAIRRACSRFFTGHGWAAEFREVGTDQFPGFFFDVPSNDAPAHAFAWDMDYTVRPEDRLRVWTDYAEMRAFFLIGVPATGLGEFGFAYDASPYGFYDIGPWLDFYDGIPAGEAAINKALWNDIVARKAGGVGFDLYKL